MDLVKRQDRKAYGEIQKFFRELEKATTSGTDYTVNGQADELHMYTTTDTALSGKSCPRSRTIQAPRMTRWSQYR